MCKCEWKIGLRVYAEQNGISDGKNSRAMKSRDGSLQSQSFPLESQEDRSPCWKHYLYLRVYLRQLVMSHTAHQLWVSPCESETDPSGMFALAGCLSRCLQTPVKIPLGTSHSDELRICQANVLACDGGTGAVWQLEGCRLQAPPDAIKLSVSNILNPNLQCWYLAWQLQPPVYECVCEWLNERLTF